METGNRPDQYAYDGFADHGGRLCYSDLCGRPVAFHAVLQRGWKMAEFFGCAVYGMFGGLCDRSCDNYSSGAVHAGRKADPASSDSAWRPRHHSMHDGRLSYSEETDHDPQPGHDPGQL